MLGTNKENEETDVFELLDYLSNNTRRRILELLSAEDLYSFQISRMMDISPRIIAKYLEELEKIGIVSIEERKSDKGPFRKYASLNKAFSLIIDVGQNTFNVKYFPTGEVVGSEIKTKITNTAAVEEKRNEQLKKKLKQESTDIRDSIKTKINELKELNQQRQDCVEEINEAFYRFNNIIEKIVHSYNDREIYRRIFKIIITKPDNKVSLSELASWARMWRGDLHGRIEVLADQTGCITIQKDRRGEIWYSI
ncbi:MAG: ArsR family transcriptional regulator [Candidatus Heimdallarchaeota archaeon]|nr:ArsR family transcriptional regulator [Candidatus Heimdallarchaeota archaeon]